MLLLSSCGGNRNIDELPQPEIIPGAASIETISTLVRNHEISVSNDRFLITFTVDQYFSTGRSQRIESFLFLNLDNGIIYDSINRKKVGNAICLIEEATNLKACKKMEWSLDKKAIRTTIQCNKPKECPKSISPKKVLVSLYSEFDYFTSFAEEPTIEVGRVQKWLFSISEENKQIEKEKKNDKKKKNGISFLTTLVKAKNTSIAFKEPNRIELQQLVPHLTQGDGQRRQNTGVFPLVRSINELQDIFYTSFKKVKNEDHIRLDFMFVQDSSLEEKNGHLILKKVVR